MAALRNLAAGWAGLTDRERLLLVLATVALLAAGLYWGVYQPLSDSRTANIARTLRYERTTAALATMPISAQAVADPRPIATIVTESAATQGLTILRLDTPKPDMATVTLQDAPFETLLLWIDGLNRDGGVNVAAATIRRADDLGSVSADLVLSKVLP
jgi:general secretion pathway protein M